MKFESSKNFASSRKKFASLKKFEFEVQLKLFVLFVFRRFSRKKKFESLKSLNFKFNSNPYLQPRGSKLSEITTVGARENTAAENAVNWAQQTKYEHN